MNAINATGTFMGRLSGCHIREEAGEVLYSITDKRNGDVFQRVPAEMTVSGKRDIWIGVGIIENLTAKSDDGEVLFRLV